MRLGYNTNGLTDHDLQSAVELVADLGYTAIAITLDHHTLNPFGDRLENQLEVVQLSLRQFRLLPVVETGARYLLDPQRKHQPTLVSTARIERSIRIDFLRRAIDIAAQLDAHCVSFWSGTALDDAAETALLERLAESLKPVIAHAAERGVTLAFEPEPGHVVDTMAAYERLLDAMPAGDADALRLTIDIGHLHCQGETPIAEQLRRWAGRLENIHIDDMRHGVHEHLPLGEGEIDFGPVMATLGKMGYKGPVTVELPRHSHCGPQMAAESIDFLREFVAT